MFADTLSSRSAAFRACAFAPDSPGGCAAASTATTHTTFASLTVGVLGYGHIGHAVARMAAGLGATVVATRRSGPFEPAPPPLAWISPSNDRLLRAVDVLFVTVAGSAGQVLNATSLRLLRDGAHVVPTAAETVDWDALAAELERRPSLFATLDNWPRGCWRWPDAECGREGAPSWPAATRFAALPNALTTPAMAMRDEVLWAESAAFVARNLRALLEGAPLEFVVRNGSSPRATVRATGRPASETVRI